ncbi:hypothetical protein GCM10011380_00310 [Sphingomonas metalli]|uniref:Uncharacterized protein n=1 Tax=Sphingomonas metalli TaxID=1779358 RepID=A0A916WNL4_9SPHN|nr:hypothetical protein [Sphingomonas metalli]GGB14837.1 hypothetical protein GCM10011380_00310 [Sphingomonas metalli]
MTDTTAAGSLEAALDKIAADNGLTSVSVGRMVVGDRIVRTANVHYTGYARDGIGCSQGHSDVSIRLALTEALTKAAQNRTPEIVGADALPALEQAA